MALPIGVPGYRLGEGPLFLTGEPRREYYFSFLLAMMPHDYFSKEDTKLGTAWKLIVFNPVTMLYTSGLAEKVTLPPHKFTLGQVGLGTLQVPFPQHFEISTFSVSYIEDELGSVNFFHRMWMEGIRGFGDNGGGGLTFEELGKVCAMAIYAPSKKIPIGSISLEIPLPTGLEVYPRVFPVQIDKDPPNRSGNSLSKTTVTYARVPRVKLYRPAHEWWGQDLKPPGTKVVEVIEEKE
jgi:hypothetical protein